VDVAKDQLGSTLKQRLTNQKFPRLYYLLPNVTDTSIQLGKKLRKQKNPPSGIFNSNCIYWEITKSFFRLGGWGGGDFPDRPGLRRGREQVTVFSNIPRKM